MKLAAVLASLVLHVAGLLAIPTGTRSDTAVDMPASVALSTGSCKCDLEIGAASDCTPAPR